MSFSNLAIALLCAFSAIPSAAEAQEFRISYMPLARMLFDPEGETRPDNLRDRFSLNEDGIITANDLHGLMRQLDPVFYIQILQTHQALADPALPAELRGKAEEYLKESAERMQTLTELGMGLLSLSRVIDHEGVKSMLIPRLRAERVAYALREILEENARQGLADGSIASAPNPTTTSNEALYALLKQREEKAKLNAQAQGEHYISFTFRADWEKSDHLRSLVRGGSDLRGWEALTFTYECEKTGPALWSSCFPKDWRALEKDLYARLEPFHRELFRKTAWKLTEFRLGLSGMYEDHAVSYAELDRLYALMREQQFKREQRIASVQTLRVSGLPAAVSGFKILFLERFEARKQLHLQELARSLTLPPEQRRARVQALRESVPREVLGETLADPALASWVASNDLVAELRAERWIQEDPATAAPRPTPGTEPTIEEIQRRMAFDPMSTVRFLFPFHQTTDATGELRMAFLVETAAGEATYLPRGDAQVEQALVQAYEARVQALKYREQAVRMLDLNSVFLEVNGGCWDKIWPCLVTDQKKRKTLWRRFLFPETTMGEEDRNEGVSLYFFLKVFEIPNS